MSKKSKATQANLQILLEEFKEIQRAFDRMVFAAETFDEARLLLKIRHEKEAELFDKFRLANDFIRLDLIDLAELSEPSEKKNEKI